MRLAVAPMVSAVHRRGEEILAEAEAVHRRTLILTLALTALIALAACVVAGVIARRISRPLSELVFATRRITAGDWGYQAGVARTGEIGELAASLNRMVQEVNRHRQALEEHNRTLEERVRQRTEELHRKEHELLQSERLAALGRLAAGVAHELNNPLTSIVMNTNLLIEEAGEGTPLRWELAKIDADAGRCRRIIDDLRGFARAWHVERVPTDPAGVVEQALSSAAHEMGRQGVVVRREIASGLPKIALDPDRMVQVLTNVLVNAAQASAPGGRVTMRAARDQDGLRLEVEDDGPGIPPEHRASIFDPFFTTKPDGTGLGLSISHGIVQEHGGRIEVESRTREEAGPDERTGTTVRIILPIVEAAP
jgi:two-component system NtrC family sensor kinase